MYRLLNNYVVKSYHLLISDVYLFISVYYLPFFVDVIFIPKQIKFSSDSIRHLILFCKSTDDGQQRGADF